LYLEIVRRSHRARSLPGQPAGYPERQHHAAV